MPPRDRNPDRTLRALLAGVVLFLAPAPGLGQEQPEPPLRLLARVLPEATEFTPKEGSPPVFRGYRSDSEGQRVLVGYAFHTSDLPPEEPGYNDPIEVLVGMDLNGVLTGVVVTHYTESLRRSRGDFLGPRDFQDQFAGKSIGDAFRVRRDVDGISGATITVAAMSLGIRNAARRVAAAYLVAGGTGAGGVPGAAGVAPMGGPADSWRGMVAAGLAYQILAEQRDLALFELSLAPILQPATGDLLLGPTMFREGAGGFGPDAADGPLFLMAIDGGQWDRFRPPHLAFVQDGDTFRVAVADVRVLGPPRAGLLEGEVRRAWLLRARRELEITRPFITVLDIPPARGAFAVEQPGWPAAPPAPSAVASAPTEGVASAAAPSPDPVHATPQSGGTSGGVAPPVTSHGVTAAAADSVTPVAASVHGGADPSPAPGPPIPLASGSGPPPFDLSLLDLAEDEEESVLHRTLARTSWSRLGLIGGLLLLVTAAFAAKRRGLRRVTLVATVVVLGFTGSFLSVSHVISAIRVGPSAFLNDLPLLLLALFTIVTTLLWGRVFCGFLCPFGALQDALERIVPRRFRREPSPAFHRQAYLAKYGILGAVLAPSLLGSDLSLFQYFEPFGTVFFLSPSLLLWAIALAILAASAVVPRFYCRYACPLGAALAVGSTLSPFRIRRVEQCGLCTVCERRCPTGAIRRERVDFRECVRCNVCETQLIERAGVCRHAMDDVRPRLVQLGSRPGREG
jgi:Na+-translocating ferredoxin:NAD+ oxidoreductase RnfG subunit/NAD-dependent dihydropyrimidine dehydrogenase PreA subunit